MRINFRKLKQQTGLSEDFSFARKLRDDIISDLGGRFGESVQVDIAVENTGRLFIGKGCLKTTVIFECSRCLQEFEYPVNTELYLTMAELSFKEYFPEDEEVIFFAGDELDITPYIEEAILMELPIRPLCDEDCKGLCPECGVDRNTGQCQCENKNIDPRWEKLKNLK